MNELVGEREERIGQHKKVSKRTNTKLKKISLLTLPPNLKITLKTKSALRKGQGQLTPSPNQTTHVVQKTTKHKTNVVRKKRSATKKAMPKETKKAPKSVKSQKMLNKETSKIGAPMKHVSPPEEISLTSKGDETASIGTPSPEVMKDMDIHAASQNSSEPKPPGRTEVGQKRKPPVPSAQESDRLPVTLPVSSNSKIVKDDKQHTRDTVKVDKNHTSPQPMDQKSQENEKINSSSEKAPKLELTYDQMVKLFAQEVQGILKPLEERFKEQS